MASHAGRDPRRAIIHIYLKVLLAWVVLLQAIIDGSQSVWRRLTGRPGTATQGSSGSGSTPAPAKHVAIVFAEPEEAAVSCNTVATILEWCYKADMDLVKLYDPAGYLKQREADLQDALQGFLKQLQHHLAPSAMPPTGSIHGTARHAGQEIKQISVHAGWQKDCSEEAQAKGLTTSKNINSKLTAVADPGTRNQALMKILLLSAEDAYVPILESVKHSAACFDQPIKTSHRSHQQAGQEMSGRVAKQAGWEAAQEPQLILVYSVGPLTLAGFPPWQARTAEILHMGQANQATLAGFQAALSKFSHTLQRFGR